MKSLVELAKLAALYGQLGFTIVTPPIVMALLGHWLQTRFSLGSWVMLLCLAVGLTASASGAYGFYRRVVGAEKKKKKPTETVVFYHHE